MKVTYGDCKLNLTWPPSFFRTSDGLGNFFVIKDENNMALRNSFSDIFMKNSTIHFFQIITPILLLFNILIMVLVILLKEKELYDYK